MEQNCEKPKSIICRVYIENGQTIITYEIITMFRDGKMVTVKDKIELDFILTTNIL